MPAGTGVWVVKIWLAVAHSLAVAKSNWFFSISCFICSRAKKAECPSLRW